MLQNKYKILFFLLFFIPAPKIFSQGFEGTIKLVLETLTDTTFYIYYVQNNFVRMDELDDDMKVTGYMVVNLEEKKVNAVNPERRMFLKVPVRPFLEPSNVGFETTATGNEKSIKGIPCKQWQVVNKGKNTEVIYWLANSDFNFYQELLQIMNHSEKVYSYLFQIADLQDSMPLESVEYSLLWEKRMRLAVTEIKRSKLSSNLFEIPSDFVLYQH